MTEHTQPSGVLAEMWARIAARQWDRLPELNDPGLTVRYVHTRELLDSGGFLRANSEYPGVWQVDVEEIVSDGERAVSRTRLFDDEQSFYVAPFASTSGGCGTAMTEVWTGTGQSPHPSRVAPTG